MAHETGNVISFLKQPGQHIAPKNTTKGLVDALWAVAKLQAEVANSNELGDKAAPCPVNEPMAKAYRGGAQDFVNTMFRDIMNSADPYTVDGSYQIDWLMANLFFGLATSMRDCLGARLGIHNHVYAAADNNVEMISNYLMLAQAKRGA